MVLDLGNPVGPNANNLGLSYGATSSVTAHNKFQNTQAMSLNELYQMFEQSARVATSQQQSIDNGARLQSTLMQIARSEQDFFQRLSQMAANAAPTHQSYQPVSVERVQTYAGARPSIVIA